MGKRYFSILMAAAIALLGKDVFKDFELMREMREKSGMGRKHPGGCGRFPQPRRTAKRFQVGEFWKRISKPEILEMRMKNIARNVPKAKRDAAWARLREAVS